MNEPNLLTHPLRSQAILLQIVVDRLADNSTLQSVLKGGLDLLPKFFWAAALVFFTRTVALNYKMLALFVRKSRSVPYLIGLLFVMKNLPLTVPY